MTETTLDLSGAGAAPAAPAPAPATPAPTATPAAAPAAAPTPTPATAPTPATDAPAPAGGDPSWLDSFMASDEADRTNDFFPVTDDEPLDAPPPGPEGTADAVAPETTPPAQEQPGQEAQPQAQPEAAPADRREEGSGPEDLAQKLQQNADAFVDRLADEFYAMTPEMVAAFESEPEKVLPMLAAQVHYNVVQGVLNTIANIVPQMILDVQSARTKSDGLIKQFYDANPALNAKEHNETVMRVARVYRQQNPKASSADMIRDVGTIVAQLVGAQAPAPAPAAAEKPAPFAPASPARVSNKQPLSGSWLEGLTQDYD